MEIVKLDKQVLQLWQAQLMTVETKGQSSVTVIGIIRDMESLLNLKQNERDAE